jgi:hypothetical protein
MSAQRRRRREEHMADEKKEKWLSWLALTTVIFAVGATLATFKGGSYSTRALLSPTQASDQWAFFQAKSIKGNLYALQKEQLELQLGLLGAGAPPEVRSGIEKRIAASAQRVQKYEQEQGQIRGEAEALEKNRDECKRHQGAFGIAVIFLQITILLSSVAALLKRRPLWYAALVLGTLGMVQFANGFLLFFEN